ncbi:MAG: hypothetical protein KF749_01080 [Bacteroidetes bacterium]|nr:hypothetical protein [Bacteroidota bacterium]MCW5897256.1 hypothetical protein [Bacteroidota bacterium]
MKTRQNPIGVVARVFFLPMWMFLSGCSLIGFGIGAAIDGGKPDKETVLPESSPGLAVGQPVRITRVDSTSVEGMYEGVTNLDSVKYAERYGGFTATAGGESAFPKLGETLDLYTVSGKLGGEYRFRGFGFGTLQVAVITDDGNSLAQLTFSQLVRVTDRQGDEFDLSRFARLSDEGRLPRNVALALTTGIGGMQVPFDDVARIEVNNSKNAKWIGGGIGLALDIAYLVAASIAFDRWGRDEGWLLGWNPGR